ncbi:MAG: helix-turn-helix domain-containing protein, partial [Candidatus Freyarchaeota archaeon]
MNPLKVNRRQKSPPKRLKWSHFEAILCIYKGYFGLQNSQVLTVASSRKFTEEELKQLYSQGLTVRQIAEKLGVSETTILKRMKRLGLDTKR